MMGYYTVYTFGLMHAAYYSTVHSPGPDTILLI